VKRAVLLLMGLVLATMGWAGPDNEPFGPAQAAADVMRAAANADIAFLPAGVLKPGFKSGELSKMLQFPTDEVVVLTLTGAQIRQALERSVAMVPSPNPGFLQVSGLTVVYSPAGAPNKRVVSVSVSGADLQLSREYRVAMPGSLARGGLGYFTVWDKSAKSETLPNTNLESLLKGKSGTETEPRYRATG
jgi:2',3'-cyclic-nucleotide 2'-phosphodiesterase (5'-nucleotidase family)